MIWPRHGSDGPYRAREDIFHRHQEGLIDRTRRQRHILIHRLHQLVDLLLPLCFAVQRAQRRAANHRHIVAGEAVLAQQLAHFHLDQVDQLRILDRIALVQEHHDVRHAYLASQKHVLLGLRHRSVGRRHHQDCAIHLRRTGDHVLDVIGVAGAIHVRVVTVPEEHMGTIIGDINSRRGRIEGMEHSGGSQVIKAMVPLKEMFGYVNDIRSSTQGRASYSMQFARYEEAPRMISEEIIGRNQGK